MKRTNLFLIPFALTMLAGCNSDDGSGKTNIIMWHNSNATTQATLEGFITAFEAANPDISVTLNKISGGYDKILDNTITGLAAQKLDTYPDIFLGYPDSVAQLITSGKVVDLEPFMTSEEVGWTQEEIEDDIIPAYLEEGKHYQIPGTYTAPYAKSTEAMYYNKVLIGMDLSGIDASINDGQPLTEAYINDLTWEELFDKLCPALMEKNALTADEGGQFLDTSGTKYGIVSWSSDDNAFITLCEQYDLPYTSLDENTGVGSADFNTPEVKSMLQKFWTAKNNHYFLTKLSNGDSYTNSLFTKRKTLFDIGSTGGGQYYGGENNTDVNVRLARIPHAAGKARKVINQGPSLAILNKTPESVVAAWKFYKFITNPTNALVFSLNTGYSPIRYSVFETDEWIEHADAENLPEKSLDKVYAQIANYVPTVTDDLFSSPVFNGSAKCRTEAGSLFGTVMNLTAWNDTTVSNAMSTAVANAFEYIY